MATARSAVSLATTVIPTVFVTAARPPRPLRPGPERVVFFYPR
jgi:hypothetical protein